MPARTSSSRMGMTIISGYIQLLLWVGLVLFDYSAGRGGRKAGPGCDKFPWTAIYWLVVVSRDVPRGTFVLVARGSIPGGIFEHWFCLHYSPWVPPPLKAKVLIPRGLFWH